MTLPKLSQYLTVAPLLAALALPALLPPSGGEAPAPRILCTPDSLRIDGGRSRPSGNPIAEALQNAKPGSVIELQNGDYPGFGIGFGKNAGWNARTSGGRPGQPITVRGLGERVRVIPTGGDTISINPAMNPGHITFENLVIVPGNRAGVIFYKPGRAHAYEGFRFLDCDVIGEWDHVTNRGPRSSKWAVWGHSLKDFEFRGVSRPAVVRDIRQEHGFYLQNARGDITIENVHAARLGRTFCQFTARPKDGDPGVGTITVRDCLIEDACIGAGDGYKGGSALTLAGRHTGTVIFERNRVRCGFDKRLKHLTRGKVAYGTGALVAWDARTTPSNRLILRDNRFEFARDSGDRALVSIGGCREVVIEGDNAFLAGSHAVALDIDPVVGGDRARPRNTPVGSILVAPSTVIRGVVERRGNRLSKVQIAALAVPAEPLEGAGSSASGDPPEGGGD